MKSVYEKKIHPNYHKITVQMTDGTEFETRSTWEKVSTHLNLILIQSHIPWTGGAKNFRQRKVSK